MRTTCTTLAAVLAFAVLPAWSVGLRFKTPEAALAYYVRSANAKSLEGINATLLNPVSDFNFASSVPVEAFRIVKQIRLTDRQANDWNLKGIIPSAAVGDIELHVEETIAGKVLMYSYNFRETKSGWKILSFASWDQE